MLKERFNFRNSIPSNQGCSHKTGNSKQMAPKQWILLLEAKIKKKDDLIRYLERKCGQHIMKTTSEMAKQIDQLKQRNLELNTQLSSTRFQSSPIQQSNVPILRYNDVTKRVFYDGELIESLNDQELINEIITKNTEIHSLLVKLQLKRNNINECLDNAMSNGNLGYQVEDICCLGEHAKLTQSHDYQIMRTSISKITSATKSNMSALNHESVANQSKNSHEHSETHNQLCWQEIDLLGFQKLINNSTRQSSLFSKSSRETQVESCDFCSLQTQTEWVQKNEQNRNQHSQLEEELKLAQDTIQMAKSKYEEIQGQFKSLSLTNFELLEEIAYLKSQLCYFSEKIEICQQRIHEMQQMNSLSKYSNRQVKYSELEENYVEILGIFNVNLTDNGSHEKLLQEILSLKDQLTCMVKSIKISNEENNDLEDQNNFFKEKCQALENFNAQLQFTSRKVIEGLQVSNETIMLKSIELLALKKQCAFLSQKQPIKTECFLVS